jgi:hypothetical protein
VLNVYDSLFFLINNKMIIVPNFTLRHRNTIVANQIDSDLQTELFLPSTGSTGFTGPTGPIGPSPTGPTGPTGPSPTGPQFEIFHRNTVIQMFNNVTYTVVDFGGAGYDMFPAGGPAVNTGFTYDGNTGTVTIGADGLYEIFVQASFRQNGGGQVTQFTYYVERNPGGYRLNEDKFIVGTTMVTPAFGYADTWVGRLSSGDTLNFKILSSNNNVFLAWLNNNPATVWTIRKIN